MFRNLLTLIGVCFTSASAAIAAPPYQPYASKATNGIYNLLFCDDSSAFQPKPGQSPTPWQTTLFSEPADTAALETLAADASQEGRLRYLAYQRLRSAGKKVPGKILLGIIVEVPLAEGLDTLAAYSDGGVRYINKTGKLGVYEGVASLQPLIQNLFKASQAVVDRIGPSDRPRLPPPGSGNIRLTFLVSDGLYFGEGPMSRMQHDPMAGPVIDRAIVVLQQLNVVGATSKPQ